MGIVMIRFLLVVFVVTLLFATRSDTRIPRKPILAKRIAITAQAIDLFAGQPKRRQFGKLQFLGGWVLKSDAAFFGGLSALDVRAGQFIALSDQGAIIRFRQRADGSVDQASIVPVPKGCSRNRYKADQDMESMARAADNGPIWVGIEWRNMLCRFSKDMAHAESEAAPPSMAAWPRTGGAEAMAWLKDGRLAIFAERAFDSDADQTPVLLFDGDPTRPAVRAVQMMYDVPKGYRVVDAATLPDGRVLVLTRAFKLPYRFRGRLDVVDPAQFKSGAVLKGRLLAAFTPPSLTDNFEGLAIERTNHGTILWITSDDNFSWLQRTLLLKFKLL